MNNRLENQRYIWATRGPGEDMPKKARVDSTVVSAVGGDNVYWVSTVLLQSSLDPSTFETLVFKLPWDADVQKFYDNEDSEFRETSENPMAKYNSEFESRRAARENHDKAVGEAELILDRNLTEKVSRFINSARI